MRSEAISKRVNTLWIVIAFSAVALLLAFFVPTAYSRFAEAIVLSAIAVVVCLFIRKRGIRSSHYRQVTGILTVAAAVYLMLTYILGIRFGFYQNYPQLSLDTLFRYVLPAAVIIIATEIIRWVFLSQKGKAIIVISYLFCVSADLLLGKGVIFGQGLDYFLDIIALNLIPAMTSNLLYHYLSKRYGVLPNIVYRLVITIVPSLLPIIPALPDSMNSFLLLILPLVLWVFIDALYGKKKKTVLKRSSKWGYVATGVMLVSMTLSIMLITCQFRFGLLVIATPSMEGEISVGDAVVYEEYKGQDIRKGDIIVFGKDNGSKIVHRVVDMEKINGQMRYYTKGDANEDVDYGYITDSNIQGIVQFKVPAIGGPTLWLRGLFNS